jgi:hypothetical protein
MININYFLLEYFNFEIFMILHGLISSYSISEIFTLIQIPILFMIYFFFLLSRQIHLLTSKYYYLINEIFLLKFKLID